MSPATTPPRLTRSEKRRCIGHAIGAIDGKHSKARKALVVIPHGTEIAPRDSQDLAGFAFDGFSSTHLQECFVSQIIPFDFDGSAVRVVQQGGEPWFVATDVCQVLTIANSSDALSRLDEDDRDDLGIADAMGRNQLTAVVNESGLYSLILTSRKPEARRFKKWVTGEVLPSIRKTGRYEAAAAQPVPKLVAPTKDFKAAYGLLRLIGCDKQAATIGANQATAKIHGANLLALTGQTHLAAANQDALFFTPSELGRRMGLSGQKFNLMLAGAGLQSKPDGKTWELTEAGKTHGRIYDTGKSHSSGVPVQQIKWSADVLHLLGGEKEAA